MQIDRQKKGALVVTTYKGSRIKVTATYTAESSKKGVNSKTWTRTVAQ